VTARTSYAVHLEPYEEEAVTGVPTPTAPTIIPTAVGEEPLVIEILSAA